MDEQRVRETIREEIEAARMTFSGGSYLPLDGAVTVSVDSVELEQRMNNRIRDHEAEKHFDAGIHLIAEA